MQIRVERLREDVASIAACTATPGNGASRPTFSSPWRAAVDHITSELHRAGCDVRTDSAGNLHARQAALGWDQPAWMSGSHLDSVPNGGDFDGVVGVVTPLEVLRAASDAARTVPLELVVFAEEEGTTFGLGMLGSRAWIGDLTAQRLSDLRNIAGEDYLTAGAAHGVIAARIDDESWQQRAAHGRPKPAVRGFIEVHIEQGPALWKQGQPLAIVNAIAGRRQYRCAVRGTANHAGSTGMADRHDALACSAEIITSLEATARRFGDRTVITVGRIECEPNAVNVIAGCVTFTIDFRAADDARLEAGDAEIRRHVAMICQRRSVRFELAATESQRAVPLSAALCEQLREAARSVGMPGIHTTISGALHDAAIVAPHIPTAMMFIPSRDGISHNPAEFSRIEDAALAARVLASAVSNTAT